MSEDLQAKVSKLELDVALPKQELYYVKEASKNIKNVFGWAVALSLGGVITAIINFIVSGGLIP